MDYLTFSQIKELFTSISPDETVEYERVRSHNKGEIRKKESSVLSDLLLEIEESIEEEWIHGGDLEIPIPEKKQILVGHHDGLYWIENAKKSLNVYKNNATFSLLSNLNQPPQ